MVSEFGVEDAGFGLDVAVCDVDTVHRAHALQAHDQASIDRIRATGQSGSRTSGHHGDPVLVCRRDDGAHLLGVPGKHGREGLTKLRAKRSVRGIGPKDVGVGDNVAGIQGGVCGREDSVFRCHAQPLTTAAMVSIARLVAGDG